MYLVTIRTCFKSKFLDKVKVAKVQNLLIPGLVNTSLRGYKKIEFRH